MPLDVKSTKSPLHAARNGLKFMLMSWRGGSRPGEWVEGHDEPDRKSQSFALFSCGNVCVCTGRVWAGVLASLGWSTGALDMHGAAGEAR